VWYRSAYLDSEQRITAARVIKRFIMHAKKTGFIVEHDFIMATYLADRVVVYEGTPSVSCTATAPQVRTYVWGGHEVVRICLVGCADVSEWALTSS